MYTCAINTPLGMMTAAAENEALTGLWFRGQQYFPKQTNEWINRPDYRLFESLRIWLAAYFTGQNPPPSFPLDPRGTDFQRSVWNILLTIPYGGLSTYGKIAKQIAAKKGLPSMSAQAVGGAVGRNPISIVIPCHRVVGSDGTLTGYAGGLDKKKALLELETPAL
jgi:methylated-DNA-[protein]-cysteine S-methyltransferase